MAKDPERRYQSAAEMGQALRDAVPGLPTPARTPPREPTPPQAAAPPEQASQRPHAVQGRPSRLLRWLIGKGAGVVLVLWGLFSLFIGQNNAFEGEYLTGGLLLAAGVLALAGGLIALRRRGIAFGPLGRGRLTALLAVAGLALFAAGGSQQAKDQPGPALPGSGAIAVVSTVAPTPTRTPTFVLPVPIAAPIPVAMLLPMATSTATSTSVVQTTSTSVVQTATSTPVVRIATLAATFTPVSAPVVQTATSTATATPVVQIATSTPTSAPVAVPVSVAEGQQYGGRLRLGVVDFGTMDPALTGLSEGSPIYSELTYGNAIVTAFDGTLTPWAIESWSANANASRYTFKVRQGVKFHSGDPLTAEDIKFTFDRILDEATASPLKREIDFITNISTLDNYTVVFQLEGPNAFLPALMTDYHARVVPVNITNEEITIGEYGAGAFILGQHNAAERTVLKRNPNYWRAGPTLPG